MKVFNVMDYKHKLMNQLKGAKFPYAMAEEEKDFPSLFVLVKACGEEFWNLERWSEKSWKVVGLKKGNRIFEANTVFVKEVGDTPEIAVARLWLKLNGYETGLPS